MVSRCADAVLHSLSPAAVDEEADEDGLGSFDPAIARALSDACRHHRQQVLSVALPIL